VQLPQKGPKAYKEKPVKSLRLLGLFGLL